jgi:nickel/cobalt transporter (NiCoT) family protein
VAPRTRLHEAGGAVIGLSAFTVFVLGLRHGADPDHLAAIDNVTRNAYVRTPALSRFVGTLFAGGHSVMVLAISAGVGLLGARFARHGALVETIGTWISIAVLLAIAALNLAALRRGDVRVTGAKTRLLPRRLRETSNVLVAIPIGLLFGFGFETSSQLLAFSLAFTPGGGVAGGVLVGAMFCVGMVCTDTLDSLIVHRLISHGNGGVPAVMRVWIVSVTALAVAVAAYELAQVLGWRSPIGDLTVSGGLLAVLLAVFAYVVAAGRRAHVPVQRGARLSRNAVSPSRKSALP